MIADMTNAEASALGREWKRRAHAVGLRLVREATYQHEREGTPVRSPRDVFRLMEPIAEREPTEVFWLLALNAQHRLIGGGPIAVSRGTLTSSLVHPREVFRAAIVAGAAAVILCHNHPSGDPTPSADDRMVTEQLVAAGRLLDLPVHDHLIVGAGRYTSFAEAGLL
jgi:DNA repair protein RadC